MTSRTRHNIILAALSAATLVVAGCTIEEEFFENPSPINYRGEPVEAFLDIAVGGLSVSTRATEENQAYLEDSDAERWVNDLWVFQYWASNSKEITDPVYVDMAAYDYDQTILNNVPVTLSDNDGEESIIYVVTNTGDASWAGSIDHTTIDGLLASKLPTHEPIFFTDATEVSGLSIPMEGDSGSVVVGKGRSVRVPVSRMYAKLMIDPIVDIDIEVEVTDEYGNVTGTETVKAETVIYSVSVGNIPLYCRVGSLWDEVGAGASSATYPDDVQWVSRAFKDEVVDGSAGSGDEGGDAGSSGEGTTEVEDLGYRYIVYVPENLQGTVDGVETTKADNAPSHALQIDIVITYFDPTDGAETRYPYTVYPGANSTDDFNIKRNNVYRVKVNINELSLERVPSANCFVALEGETLSFYPYYRVETGGGYDFTDYLDPEGGDAQVDKGAKIDHVGIVWQTKDCIGNNTNGDLVYFTNQHGAKINSTDDQTGFEQIHVHATTEGNALIAAYDDAGNIIWSWHIWVRTEANGDPTHPANALRYYTYNWDETGIYGEYQTDGNAQRVAGYEIMACNLGALQDKPNWNYCKHLGLENTSANGAQTFDEGDGIARTFGMLYQWGRKDPFPPMITTNGDTGNLTTSTSPTYEEGHDNGYYTHDYNDDHTEQLYGNDNKTEVHKTSYDENGPKYSGATSYGSYLFYSHIHTGENTGGVEGDEGSDVVSGMRYAVAHPTVFLCGYNEIGYSLNKQMADQKTQDSSTFRDEMGKISNYPFGGAWSNEDHDNREWGGLEPSDNLKHYDLRITDDAGYPIVIYDDYDDETSLGSKSIFDPCPYGWRVASGELWLGFTKSGINPYDDPWDSASSPAGSMDNINVDPSYSCALGMSMYLGNGWRTGETSWFPNQGFRLPDGCGYRVGGCGNYVNANASANDRVNIIHTHFNYSYFKQFETQTHYTRKSAANPLRCVRDSE